MLSKQALDEGKKNNSLASPVSGRLAVVAGGEGATAAALHQTEVLWAEQEAGPSLKGLIRKEGPQVRLLGAMRQVE